ncbi:hypothetical protein KKF64_01655 [Patescibacteria group bacterium]|nr:hypothetical protein [Patescibacteria group bacterium]
MRKDKEKALALRLRGYSYSEINKKLGVPKATLSDWFTGIVLAEKAQTRIQKRVQKKSIDGLIKRNKMQTHLAIKRASEIRNNAQKEIKKLSKQDLLLLGAALYWAEGYKRPIVKNRKERSYHVISFSNSDPAMIKIFIEFLKKILYIPDNKIKASIRIFKHLNEKQVLKYWKKITDLPDENFHISDYIISKSSQGKKPYNRLPYGMIQIRVGDTKSFHKIMGWIQGLEKQFN